MRSVAIGHDKNVAEKFYITKSSLIFKGAHLLYNYGIRNQGRVGRREFVEDSIIYMMNQHEIKKLHQEPNTALDSHNRHHQPQQINAKTRSPSTSTSSIISLSKLKSYMPQNNVTSKLIPCLARASIAKPVAHMASIGACYRRKGALPDPSSCKLDRIFLINVGLRDRGIVNTLNLL